MKAVLLPIVLLLNVTLWTFSGEAQNLATVPGLLVMAHGGSEEWNEAIREAVLPLRRSYPVAIAFGMANPETLQAAVDELEALNVPAIHVVRLFISGDSFLPETEYAFGLRPEPAAGHHMFEPRILNVSVPVYLNSDGLLDAVELGSLLAERASGLSADPSTETVLIIGHGPASDEENDRWLLKMDQMAEAARIASPYHDVRVATLREDWTGKREVVEQELRTLVTAENGAGRTVLVIPFRLHGFGPYHEVLQGLVYRSNGLAFLPDSRLTDWIESQYQAISPVSLPGK